MIDKIVYMPCRLSNYPFSSEVPCRLSNYPFSPEVLSSKTPQVQVVQSFHRRALRLLGFEHMHAVHNHQQFRQVAVVPP